MNNPGFIENDQAFSRQVAGKICKNILFNQTLIANQKFRQIPDVQRILSNSAIWQMIIKPVDIYKTRVLGIFHAAITDYFSCKDIKHSLFRTFAMKQKIDENSQHQV